MKRQVLARFLLTAAGAAIALLAGGVSPINADSGTTDRVSVHSDGSQGDYGSYFPLLANGGWPSHTQTVLLTLDTPNPQVDARLGYSVAVGDVNGDGKGHIGAGALWEDVGGNADQGRAYVFSGDAGSYADLGNPSDEAFHNLEGWGGAQGPPDNPHVSPTGDWTKRYQNIGEANSVDLYPTAGEESYFLLAEVEDGQCEDNFEIWVGPCSASQERVYEYEAVPGEPTTVGRHVAGVDGSLVGECTTVTFQNKAQDGCGSAAVYNVSIQTERPSTIVVVRDEWETESCECPTPETCNPDRPQLAIARVNHFRGVYGLVLANDFSGEYHRAEATPLASGVLATTVAVRPNDTGGITFRVARKGYLPCTVIKVDPESGLKLYECSTDSSDSFKVTVSANTNFDAQPPPSGDGGAKYRAAYVGFSPYSGNDHRCPVTGAVTEFGSALQGRCMFGSAALVITPAKVVREECTDGAGCGLEATAYGGVLDGAANPFQVPKLVLQGLFKSESFDHYQEDPDGTYRTFITFDGGIGFSQVTGNTVPILVTDQPLLQELANFCSPMPSRSCELVSCVAKSPEADIYAGARFLAEHKWSSAQCQIPGTDERKAIANWVWPVRKYKNRSDVTTAFCDPELPFKQYWDSPIYVQDYASSDVAVGSGQCTLQGVFGSGCEGQVLAVHIHQGEQKEAGVAILPDQEEADFFTQGFGSTVDTTLVTPDGTAIGPDSADPDIYHVKALTYELYRIAGPQAGDWTVRLFGTELPPEGEDITVWVSTVSGPASIPVGGIAKLPDVSDSSGRNYTPLAVLAAVAVAALTAGAWYARRRWLG